jgi:hypothetical protein
MEMLSNKTVIAFINVLNLVFKHSNYVVSLQFKECSKVATKKAKNNIFTL